MQRMTTAEATVEALLRHGIDTLYCLPGVHNDQLFDAIHRDGKLRVIHARHEQTAGYMALGAALATGKPQVFSVVPGPGLLNAGAALLTAYGMGAPVLALVGQIPQFAIDQGHGHLHEIRDQLGLLRHLTKHAARINLIRGLLASLDYKGKDVRLLAAAPEVVFDAGAEHQKLAP